MKAMVHIGLTTTLLVAMATGGAVAADSDYVFKVKSTMLGEVSEFRNGGKELEELRTYNVANNPIYMTNVEQQALMPLYDFLSCAKLTNPTSDLEISSGGGFDITMTNIKFAHGMWPVDIRITQIDQIHLLEKNSVYILQSFTIGDTGLYDPD